jgi:hypothetical protein
LKAKLETSNFTIVGLLQIDEKKFIEDIVIDIIIDGMNAGPKKIMLPLVKLTLPLMVNVNHLGILKDYEVKD